MHRLLHILATLLAWPAVLAHELSHYAVARGAGADVQVRVAAARPATVVEAWQPTASGWRIVTAAYAPLIVGLVLGAGALVAAVVTGWPTPSTVREWAIATLGLGWYVVFVLPSQGDLETAQEGLDRVRE